MKTRVLTAVITLPALAGMIFLGGMFTFFMFALFSMVATYEYNKAFRLDKGPIQMVTILASGAYYVMIYLSGFQYTEFFMILYFVVLALVFIGYYPKYHFKDITILMVGFIYTTKLFAYMPMIREMEISGIYYVWVVFIIAFGSDIAAYIVGKNLGKHKLIEKLSPNKTIEGAVGGVLGSGVLMVLYGLYMLHNGVLEEPIYLLVLGGLGAFGAVLGQAGDLVASGIKRLTGIKDFGHILPGHGGILDRFDSILLLSPLVYYITIWIPHISDMPF